MNWKRIISLVGAIVAFSIGSGFVTGQEILQFFASYIGYLGIIICLCIACTHYLKKKRLIRKRKHP